LMSWLFCKKRRATKGDFDPKLSIYPEKNAKLSKELSKALDLVSPFHGSIFEAKSTLSSWIEREISDPNFATKTIAQTGFFCNWFLPSEVRSQFVKGCDNPTVISNVAKMRNLCKSYDLLIQNASSLLVKDAVVLSYFIDPLEKSAMIIKHSCDKVLHQLKESAQISIPTSSNKLSVTLKLSLEADVSMLTSWTDRFDTTTSFKTSIKLLFGTLQAQCLGVIPGFIETYKSNLKGAKKTGVLDAQTIREDLYEIITACENILELFGYPRDHDVGVKIPRSTVFKSIC
jgi:hypothetical protein